MANRWAVANGNWSNTATWNGGTLPASTDDVYANNFTVNIDQSITVNSLKKISGSGITAGGSFVVTAAATVTITAGIAGSDNVTSSTYLLGINAGSAAVAIVGNIVGPNTNAAEAVRVISGYTGTLTITGNIGSADASGFQNAYVVNNAAACTLILNGNIDLTNRLSPGIYCTAAATITVNGNITAGNNGGTGVQLTAGASAANLTVNGTVIGGNTGSTGYGIRGQASSSRVTVIGTIKGGAGGGDAYGVYLSAGGLRLDAMLQFGALGCAPVHCQNVVPQFIRTGANLGMQAPSDDNWPAATGTAIVVQRYTTGNPAPADVRSGTTYGPSGTSTGTLAVPPAASVAAGVPVDNTVGTAAVKLADVASVTGAQIAAAVSG